MEKAYKWQTGSKIDDKDDKEYKGQTNNTKDDDYREYEWRTKTKVDDYCVEKYGRTYYGPHKWIICLLGDGEYSIRTFKSKFEARKVRPETNMSISIMTISSEP